MKKLDDPGFYHADTLSGDILIEVQDGNDLIVRGVLDEVSVREDKDKDAWQVLLTVGPR